MIKQSIMLTEMPRRSSGSDTRGHTTRMIFTVKICIFERSNEISHFSRTKIYFHKKATPQLLEHIGLKNMKVGVKTNFGRLATIFQICSMMLTSSLILYLCSNLNYENTINLALESLGAFLSWRPKFSID